jgi:hypothetical protein
MRIFSDDFSAVGGSDHPQLQVPFSPLMAMEPAVHGYGSNIGMIAWTSGSTFSQEPEKYQN